jgi:inorganic pyrophosphatase/exopolyphosphatase
MLESRTATSTERKSKLLKRIHCACKQAEFSDIFITTYHYPDLDGLASVIGLTHLLKTDNSTLIKGKSFNPIFHKDIHPEALFALDVCSINLAELTSTQPSEQSPYIVLDASRKQDLDTEVKKVIFILDHREFTEPESFSYPVNIFTEKVGALATLISEFYNATNIQPSTNIALLLYLAINSNTLGLTTSNTSFRDRKQVRLLAEFLEKHGVTNHSSIFENMLEAKSKALIENLSDSINRETSSANHTLLIDSSRVKINVSVSQLEINDPEALLTTRSEDILYTLEQVKKSRGADDSLLVLPSRTKNKTYLILGDHSKLHLLFQEKHLKFDRSLPWLYVVDGVIPRKQIIEKLSEIKVPSCLYEAYKQGGTYWPQIRGGIHIHLLSALFENGYDSFTDELTQARLSPSQKNDLKRSMDNLHNLFGIVDLNIPESALEKEWQKSSSMMFEALNQRQDKSYRETKAMIRLALETLRNLDEPVARVFRSLFLPNPPGINDDSLKHSLNILNIQLDNIPLSTQDLKNILITATGRYIKEKLSISVPDQDTSWITSGFEL